MKLLIIEDDKKISSYVAKGFRESGACVDTVADGNDGLDLALEGNYDLAIVDVMLPGRDGLSVMPQKSLRSMILKRSRLMVSSALA